MLYSEFLAGTNTKENKYTYSEYKRIEKIYNDNNYMSKQDAYDLYQEPSGVAADLIKENEELKEKILLDNIELMNLKQLLKEYESKYEELAADHRNLKAEIQEHFNDLLRY